MSGDFLGAAEIFAMANNRMRRADSKEIMHHFRNVCGAPGKRLVAKTVTVCLVFDQVDR